MAAISRIERESIESKSTALPLSYTALNMGNHIGIEPMTSHQYRASALTS